MDPNATLATIRDLSRAVLSGEADRETAAQLAENVENLDDWLVAGGFVPTGWNAYGNR